jgi:hypothetical protein
MQSKICRYSLILVSFAAVFSCGKDAADKGDTYIVSASKMIEIRANNWSYAESRLQNKKDYQYTPSSPNLSNVIKAEVHLPAIDDSNRTVNGTILLNVAPDNMISYAAFHTDPVAQTVAYAMMLNYNHESLQALTGITSSIGEVVENNIGGNPAVSVVLSKLNSGQTADQLGITYNAGQGNFTMVIFRQSDGRYIFSYRGIRK